MTLEDVKTYLRIDEDADDAIIGIMMQAAEDYIKDAVGVYDESSAKTRMLYFLIMQDLYENRVSVVKESDKQRLAYVTNTLILQLQADQLLKEQEAEDGGGHRQAE